MPLRLYWWACWNVSLTGITCKSRRAISWTRLEFRNEEIVETGPKILTATHLISLRFPLHAGRSTVMISHSSTPKLNMSALFVTLPASGTVANTIGHSSKFLLDAFASSLLPNKERHH